MHDPFLHKVRETSAQAKTIGREAAIKHVMSLAGVSEDVANGFYDDVRRELGGEKFVVVNVFPEDVERFLSTGKLPQVYSERRKQIERAAGATTPITFAVLSKARKGNPDVAPCSIVLAGTENESVVVSGDAARIRSTSRLDYTANPSDVLYDWSDADDALASAAILALGPHEISGGLPQAMSHLKDEYRVYGPCHVLLTATLTPKNIRSIVVSDDEMAKKVRGWLNSVGRLVPVEVDATKVYLRMPFLEREEKDTPPEMDYQPMWLGIGDKVAMKPMASNPQLVGRVIDVANGKVSVQWSAGDRMIFGLQEALARLMPAPDEYDPTHGIESYSVSGMTKEASSKLVSLGVDPVDLYSVVFTMTPPLGSKPEEKMFVESMNGLGIDGEFVDGFAENEDLVYVPKRWFEANLPFGNRLVIDAAGGKPNIVVGAAPEYVLMPEFTDVFVE